MNSRDRTHRLRNMLATSAWVVAPLLIITFVFVTSMQPSPKVAEAHGTVDQSQLLAPGGFICNGVGPLGGGCGQTFTPTASNIVAFDLSVSTFTTAFNAMFVLRQWPAGPVLAGPFPVTLVLGVNHIDIPGGPIAITPATKYEIQETTANISFDGQTFGNPYAAGGFTVGDPVRTESQFVDMYFATYFLPATATPTQTQTATVTLTVTSTTTRTVTPTVTPTVTATPPATTTPIPTVRPNVAGAFLEGSSGAQRNLERAGLIPGPANSAPAVTQSGPAPTGPASTGLASTDPGASGLLRPPNTGDAGLIED